MNEFDRVLQCDDMDLLRSVQLVKHGRKRGCFSTAGAAGDKDDAVLFLDHLLEHNRKTECFQRRDFSLEFSHHHGFAAALPKNIYSKSGDIFDGVAAVAGTALSEILQQTLVTCDQVIGQLINLIWVEHATRRVDWELL